MYFLNVTEPLYFVMMLLYYTNKTFFQYFLYIMCELSMYGHNKTLTQHAQSSNLAGLGREYGG